MTMKEREFEFGGRVRSIRAPARQIPHWKFTSAQHAVACFAGEDYASRKMDAGASLSTFDLRPLKVLPISRSTISTGWIRSTTYQATAAAYETCGSRAVSGGRRRSGIRRISIAGRRQRLQLAEIGHDERVGELGRIACLLTVRSPITASRGLPSSGIRSSRAGSLRGGCPDVLHHQSGWRCDQLGPR